MISALRREVKVQGDNGLLQQFIMKKPEVGFRRGPKVVGSIVKGGVQNIMGVPHNIMGSNGF